MTLEPQPPSSHPPSEHTRSSPGEHIYSHTHLQKKKKVGHEGAHECEDGGHSVQAVSHPAVGGPFVRTYALTYMRTMSEWRPDSCAGHAYLIRAPVKARLTNTSISLLVAL